MIRLAQISVTLLAVLANFGALAAPIVPKPAEGSVVYLAEVCTC